MRGLIFSLVLSLVLGGVALTPGTARAATDQRYGAASHAGLGVASFVLTIPYGAIKTVYALTGSLVGGLAWLVTGFRNDIAREILYPAIYGDYVVSPEHVMFERPLVLSGRPPSASHREERY